MKTINASDIKNQLNITDVITYYASPVKFNKFNCPFHNDTHASATVKNNRFHCWSCSAKGDVLDFTMNLFGLNLPDACSKLNNDFNLNLTGVKIDREQVNYNKLINSACERLKARKSKKYNYYCRCYRVIYKLLLNNKELRTKKNMQLLKIYAVKCERYF